MSTSRKLLALTFIATALAAFPVLAQDKKAPEAGKPVVKQVEKNDVFIVTEVAFKPGDASASAERPARVVRALTTGTLERTFPDGRKETSAYKAGEVKVFPKDGPYSLKNVGKTTLELFVVNSAK